MADDFELIENEKGQLVLRRRGEEDIVDVRVRRAFPWSLRDQFISVRSSEGKELLLIENLKDLTAAQRAAITRSLDQQSFIPRIVRVRDVDVSFGYQEWRVETDRGPAEFRVQEREDIRFLQDGRFSIRDADGNIYELASLIELDAHSRRAIESIL
jgi:hypothetical protein